MSKFTLTTAAAVGYVLGSRAGRERYEQIAAGARRVWRDPRVQKASADVQEAATQRVRQVAPVVKDAVKDKVPGVSGGERSPVASQPAPTGTTPPPAAAAAGPSAASPTAATPTAVTPPVSPCQSPTPTANSTAVPSTSDPLDDNIGGPA